MTCSFLQRQRLRLIPGRHAGAWLRGSSFRPEALTGHWEPAAETRSPPEELESGGLWVLNQAEPFPASHQLVTGGAARWDVGTSPELQ